jgi:hypothetical protein
MCKRINLTIHQLKALDMEHMICTSVRLMKYLTETCKIRYVGLGITSDDWTFWKFIECPKLKSALKAYKSYINN